MKNILTFVIIIFLLYVENIYSQNLNVGNTGYRLEFHDGLDYEIYSYGKTRTGYPVFFSWYPIGDLDEWERIPLFAVIENTHIREDSTIYLGALYFSDSSDSPLRNTPILKSGIYRILNTEGTYNIYHASDSRKKHEVFFPEVFYIELIVYDIDKYIHIITWGYSEADIISKLKLVSNLKRNR
jgi:hypothetical protein